MHKLALILCLTSISLIAQWPNRLAPGVLRTPDGQPDLSASAPRSTDGKPDLPGLWLVKNWSSLFYATGDLKPEEMQPWAAALYKQREADFRRDSDGIHCLPPGPKAGISVGPFPIKILQTPGLVAVLYEYQTIFRQLFTDGRELPKDPNPTWMGYSVAHWEGDTLVATTAGYNDKTALDLAGHPHTEALRLTERYQRRDVGHLDLQVTFDDPKAYTRPWTLSLEYELIPDGELIEYVCENERDTPHLVGRSGEEANVSATVLTQYIGRYEMPGFPAAAISLEGARLMIDTGNTKIPLVAHSPSSFTMEGTGVDFIRDAKGAVSDMIQHWTEGDRDYVRRK